MCKLCHDRGDSIKKQYPNYKWELKHCPVCFKKVWVFVGN